MKIIDKEMKSFLVSVPWPILYGIFYFKNMDKQPECFAREQGEQVYAKDPGGDAVNVTRTFDDLLLGAFLVSAIFLLLAILFEHQFVRFQKEDANEARSTFFKCYLCLYPIQFISISASIIHIRSSNYAMACSGDFLKDT